MFFTWTAHKNLKIKATETTPAIERSPAMAAGLTDQIWTAEALLDGKHI
jgi:hypothetical protein